MTYQPVNLGALPNDNTGDTLRVGGAKINANFIELYGYISKYVNADDFSSIEAALQYASANGYKSVYVPNDHVETITAPITVSDATGVAVIVDTGAQLTIAAGGSITLINNGTWYQPSGMLNVVKTSGDSIIITGKTSRLRISQLNYIGGAGTTNGLVLNDAQFCDINIGAVQLFPGTQVLVGKTGAAAAAGTLSNYANIRFLNASTGGGSLITLGSGTSTIDATPFTEGNVLDIIFGVFQGVGATGVKFGDGGTLHDAQFNIVRGAFHDLTAAGTPPLHLVDGYANIFEGTLFSTNSTILVTCDSASARNKVIAPNVLPAGFGGAGVSNNECGGVFGQNVLISLLAPTISSGFGTGASIPSNNGPAAFNVNVGTTAGHGGVIALPTAKNGWIVNVVNLTAKAGNRADNTVVIASSASTVTLQNQTTSTGAAINWTDNDVLNISCLGY